SDAKANAEVTIPAPTPAPPPPPVTVQTEKITDGVYYLKGGTHHSVLVEFADHVVLIEAPQNEQRSIALLSEVQKLYPSKPLRYVVNTHHHFDHSGGLRTIVDAGMYTPPAANAPAPAANAPVNPNALALLDNLEKLRLDFDTILPLHGPGRVTRADLYAFVKKPLVPVSSLPDPNAAGERGGR